MRVRWLAFLILFLSVSPLARGQSYGPNCDQYPVLYGDDGFRGKSFPLEASVRDLHREGFGDQASSICIPSGWVVRVYQDTGFAGPSAELRGPDSVRDLKRQGIDGEGWGDRISSVEVFYRGPDRDLPKECSRAPYLFSNDGYRGQRLELREDIRNLRSVDFGDKASSLCVPRGWEVEFFADDNYRGARLNVRGSAAYGDLKRDRPQGADWGDRISSVRVIRRGRY